MSIYLNKLSLQCITAVGLAGAFYTGCVDSTPPKPKASAGKAGASMGGSAGASTGGKGGASAAGGKGGTGATSGGTDSMAGQDSGGAGSGAAGDGAGGSTGGTGAKGGKGGTGAITGGSGNMDAGGAAGEQAGGAAGTDATGGTAGTGGTGSGGKSGAGGTSGTGCIKAITDYYVVRNDGTVLVEQRDTNVETAIRDLDGELLSGAVATAVGTYHGCALLADKTVACWRENASRGNWAGQLGDGTIDQDAGAALQRASEVLVDVGTPLTGVTALTRGGPGLQSTCAITEDQKLYCWGDLTWLINNGSALSSPYAQAITTNGIDPLIGVKQASTAVYMACAVVEGSSDDELYCWGRNDYHNLGTGDQVSRQYPTKISGFTSPSMVSVVDYAYAAGAGGTACAVDDGKLRCWGANGTGQTGTGTAGADVTTPTTVVIQDGTTPLPVPTEIASIPGTFCALLANKTAWCWGSYFNASAGNYGATNVSLLGGPWILSSTTLWLFYATTDGQYHWGKEWARTPKCGSL